MYRFKDLKKWIRGAPLPCPVAVVGGRPQGRENCEKVCFCSYLSLKNSANGGLIGKCWNFRVDETCNF